MIQVEMSKDISDFSPKIISIFDLRQLVCVAAACAYGLPIILYADFVDFYTRFTVAAILMFPVLACGWVKPYGMTLERFAWHILKTRFLTPKKRPYVTENTYGYLDTTKTAPVKPAMARPKKRTRKERKKYKQDMARFDGRL